VEQIITMATKNHTIQANRDSTYNKSRTYVYANTNHQSKNIKRVEKQTPKLFTQFGLNWPKSGERAALQSTINEFIQEIQKRYKKLSLQYIGFKVH